MHSASGLPALLFLFTDLKSKPFWILLEQEMMGWQWHQLDHVQIICTSPDSSHASTAPLSTTTG